MDAALRHEQSAGAESKEALGLMKASLFDLHSPQQKEKGRRGRNRGQEDRWGRSAFIASLWK